MDMMSIRRRVLTARKKEKRLPSAYQEVEWIQQNANNSQINTGITCVADHKLVATFSADRRNAHVLLGAQKNGNYFDMAGSYYTDVYLRFGTDRMKTISGMAERDVLTIESEARSGYQSVSINDTYFHNGNLTITNDFDIPFYIFGSNNDGTLALGNGRLRVLSDIQLYTQGELVMNAVPCYRIADGQIGLYDTVRNVFLYNSSGSYLKGADV